MEKPIWQQFTEFKTRHNLSNHKIAEIANLYAYSDLKYARTHFSTVYGISQGTFYRVLEFAIIAKLVDKQTQDQIFLKLICNNSRHGAADGARRSLDHKDKVLRLQQEYSIAFNQHLNSFTNVDLFQICMEFGSEGLSFSEIAKRHGTSARVIEILLKKGQSVLYDTYTLVRRKLGE